MTGSNREKEKEVPVPSDWLKGFLVKHDIA